MSNYKGYRNWAARECPALKPGESYDTRDNKFSKMVQSGSKSNLMSASPVFVGNKSYRSAARHELDTVKSTDYKKPDRRGVMAKADQRQMQSKPFLGASMYQKTFNLTDHQQDIEMRGGYGIENYQRGFREVAGDRETLQLDQMACILECTYGKPAAFREVQVYQDHFDKQGLNAVTVDQFQAAVPIVRAFLSSELCATAGAPTWFKGASAPKILSGKASQSSHQADFGKYGQAPLDRPYVRKTGLASTTLDLMKGTSRSTYHIPGYGGFIPQADNNPNAMVQGDGKKTRSEIEDLRLYHRDNLPGYTGHHPGDCTNYRGEILTGSDKKTTNGATFTAHKK